MLIMTGSWVLWDVPGMADACQGRWLAGQDFQAYPQLQEETEVEN